MTLTEKEMEKAEAQGLLEYFKLTGKINTSNMMAFDHELKMKKYASPEAIIEEFYTLRLAFYQKRKVCASPAADLEHSQFALPCRTSSPTRCNSLRTNSTIRLASCK